MALKNLQVMSLMLIRLAGIGVHMRIHELRLRAVLNMPRLFKLTDVPAYQRINPHILTGYRGELTTRQCFQSAFWWTNETLNIWSHVFGWMLLTGLMVRDFYQTWRVFPTMHIVMALSVAACFQMSLVCSVLYHMLNSRSQRDLALLLTLDLMGVAISTFAGFLLTVFYGFICMPIWRIVYMTLGVILFVISVALASSKHKFTNMLKGTIFLAWLGAALLATLHFYMANGGYGNQIVREAVPRLTFLYCAGGAGMVVYLLKVPECLFPGRFDYTGCSHQWWHLSVVFVLYTSHVNAMKFTQVLINRACPVAAVVIGAEF